MALIDRERWRDLEPLLDHALTLTATERVAHEPRAVGEAHALAAGEIEISLVQQRGRAEGELGADAPKLDVGEAVQLGVERGEELLRREVPAPATAQVEKDSPPRLPSPA